MDSSSLGLNCKAISTKQITEILNTPNQTVEIDIFLLEATSTVGEIHIPANFLSYRIITDLLNLKCHGKQKNEKQQVQITIDPNAFNLSSKTLRELCIINCDLEHLNFSFLTGFNQFRVLKIKNPSNIEKVKWNHLSLLPNLKELEITINEELQNDWNEWNNWNAWTLQLRSLTNRLEKFTCYAGVDDEAADRLLQWLLNSSVKSLEFLEMNQAKITRIPPGISKFQYLIDLKISCNDTKIKMLAKNSIKFNILPQTISIYKCGISELQPGAIEG